MENIPISSGLPFSARLRLAGLLDQESIRGCDWRTLVEKMGSVTE